MGNRKLPFGYKMVVGEIVVHPQEAQAVQGIYARYLAGASFNDITDHLKEKGPPYDVDKPWNKNMVARILEDNRYAGTERFPAILSPEQLQKATQRRSERKPVVQITEAQKTLRRLCNGRPSEAVESQVLSLLNSLAAAPEQIKPQPQTVNRGELAEMERRFSAALTTSPVDAAGAKELALRLAGMQYSAIGNSEYESQRLRHLFTAAAPMAEIDAELLKSTVSQVYVKKGQASLLLKNGQIIERGSITVGENKPKVIVIPAAPKNTGTAEQRQLRVAAYCRVSTKEEDQLNSYEAQKNYYTDKIMENKSWTMADIFADEGITGTSAKKRADFMRMMKWCKQGKIDLILTKSVSRFARNTVDCLNYVRMLKAQGIAVYFEKENINSMDESTELMLTMMGAFAQAESESISGNIQAGKRYAMQRGEATINYHNLYAYEKGPDGKPRIIPEQAEVVKEIYAHYLRGDSLPMICRYLEAQHIPNIRGGTTWGRSAVRGILSNEKYVGDVLMQKTFRQDCISHKAIRNTGQRPMYLVQNNHEAIIDRKTYDAVQTELARRNALKGNTQKSTPSGRSCYTPKYALSDRVICGECGTLYRRCTWVNRGKKHIVWRCISRFDYGKKYCHDSPAVDEQQLQQAILRVINGVMSEKPVLVRRVTENLQVVIRPSRSGELTIADVDRQLEELAQEFDAVFTTAASGNGVDYSERFKAILAQQAELKAKRAEMEQRQAEDAELTSHMELAADTLEQADTAIMKWDEYQIRALVESVRILSKDEVLVRLKSGIEKIEKLQK